MLQDHSTLVLRTYIRFGVDGIATMIMPKDIKSALTKVSEDVTNLGAFLKETVKYLAAAVCLALGIAVIALVRL